MQMHALARALVPSPVLNKLRYGRFLDVLITHAPPRGVHDESDLCHAGFDARFDGSSTHVQAPLPPARTRPHLRDRRTT